MTSVARKDPAETLVKGMGKGGLKLLNMIRREHHLQRVGAVTTLTLGRVGSDVGNINPRQLKMTMNLSSRIIKMTDPIYLASSTYKDQKARKKRNLDQGGRNDLGDIPWLNQRI